jgi:rhodanese-related sulfurtransferase
MTQLISRDELRLGLENGGVIVVDALGGDYYAQQHLPGAIALVEADVDRLAPSLLPDKAAAIVTYCSNASCPNSQQVATRLATLGYTNVRKYRDGIQDWVAAGLPVETTLAVS